MGWWSRTWVRYVILACVGLAGVYGVVVVDVISRAKESYQEGDRYLEWHRQPELKKAFFEKKYQDEKAETEAAFAKKKISESLFKEKLESLVFDRDVNINESSLKYAYQYYKDTYELFSPPESSWVQKARLKTPEVLEMWKQELREKKIPFEDTMFE